MGSIKKCIFAAAIVVAAFGLSAAPAQAARIGIYVGAPVAYVPPCPGPGYAWVAGYWAQGVWVPGYWRFAGPGPRLAPGVIVRGGIGFDRGPAFYHRGFDRRFDGHFRR